MRKKKTEVKTTMKTTLLLSTACLFCCASVTWADTCGEEARSILHSTYPSFSFETVGSTPIDDLCEVVSEKNTIYFAPETGHLIFGEIWSKDGRNITAEEQEKRISRSLDSLPLSKAVKIGSGSNTVIEITDPDCPYCRKGSEFFAGRSDVTRYIFFMPLDQMHPGAARKAEFILTAKDQAKAYEQVMSGTYDQSPLPEFTPAGELAEHRKIAAGLRIGSTPRYWINGQPVSGFNPAQIEDILSNTGREKAGDH
jgi:thiol:disulfide interchange protein DsbC